MGHLDPAWIALIGTVVGTIGLKVTEHYLTKNKIKIDDARIIRDELRETLKDQRLEMRELEADVEKWRREYYDLRDQYSEIRTRLTLLTGLPQTPLPRPPGLHGPVDDEESNNDTK